MKFHAWIFHRREVTERQWLADVYWVRFLVAVRFAGQMEVVAALGERPAFGGRFPVVGAVRRTGDTGR
ncbi:hypothetical protein KY284_000700 [Solanum tuberosum]|nr:hypothetical protein KY284_000700 [Solanum tuberosum]